MDHMRPSLTADVSVRISSGCVCRVHLLIKSCMKFCEPYNGTCGTYENIGSYILA
jgi:hypothetical protein